MIAYGTIADGTIADNPASGGAPVNYDITAQHGTFSLSGQSVTISRNRALSPLHGSFALAGQDIDITYTPVTAGYELIAEHGAFTLAGQDAELSVTRLPPPITYWDVMLGGSQTPIKKKQKKQELETMFLLLG